MLSWWARGSPACLMLTSRHTTGVVVLHAQQNVSNGVVAMDAIVVRCTLLNMVSNYLSKCILGNFTITFYHVRCKLQRDNDNDNDIDNIYVAMVSSFCIKDVRTTRTQNACVAMFCGILIKQIRCHYQVSEGTRHIFNIRNGFSWDYLVNEGMLCACDVMLRQILILLIFYLTNISGMMIPTDTASRIKMQNSKTTFHPLH